MNKTLLLRITLGAALLAPIVPITPHGTAQVAAAPAAPNSLNARVIVKYKVGAVLLRKHALAVHDQIAVQAQTLGQRHGLALRSGAGLHERAQVVFAGGMSSEQLAAKLALDSEVEYAVPDGRKRAAVAPNDPRYATVGGSGPASGQWYLRPNVAGVLASIDVEPAWDITTGNNTIVVAVLDTGVRFEHLDLTTLAAGGNLLPGYDMIADVDTANDNSGRDNDASDPGDWINQADINSGRYSPCTSIDIGDSSWHGTQTAGLIGAITNNAEGMASVGRTVRVLPVRVLGKCGGFDSDIIAGMRWAAGLSVGDPGVPINPVANRAKVINLSLGGTGPCTQIYQDTVDDLAAIGVTVVASAGNGTGHAVNSPANCPGVIGVSGLRHIGTKVGFSDIGLEVSISAPAGNCVNEGVGQPCLYPILTTSNSGLTTPAGAIYTDSINASFGTSFSAPLVAGTVALMLSAQPSWTPGQLRTILRATARPFPTTGADNGSIPGPVQQCRAPDNLEQLQCYCTTSTCGAGMLDAGAAVQIAAVGVLPQITVSPAAPLSGRVLTLDAATSVVLSGRSITSYQWRIANDGGIVNGLTVSPNGASASLTPSAAGQFSVRLTVIDSAGAQATSTSNIDVAAPPSPSSSGGALGASWLILLLLAVLALARRRA
jgi:serine protease